MSVMVQPRTRMGEIYIRASRPSRQAGLKSREPICLHPGPMSLAYDEDQQTCQTVQSTTANP